MASHSSTFDDDDWDYLDEVANKAYLGSASDLLEMHLAMKDMGTYTFSGIHALVSPLEMGPEESGSSGEFAMDTPRGAANLALAFLGEFPALCPPDVKEEAVWRLQDAIPGMIRWIEKILLISPGVWPQGTRLELNDREFEELVKHDGIVSTLIELCQFNKEWTRKDIASNPYIIDLAIFLWVATHKGDVILYPLSDSRSNDPEVNCEDTFTKFFFIVTDEPWIAKEVAKAIMAGRVCSPETFVERSIQRMKATVNIHGLKHLSRFPSNTAEHAVLSHTFLAIDGLMGSGNEALRDLFMEKQAPEQFMIVLSIFGTRYHTRLQKTLPAPVEKELKASLLQVLFMTHKVVEWCFNSYPYGVAAIQSVVNKGAVKTLANCLMLGNDPDYLETIGNNSFIMLYDYLSRCSVFPKIQLAVMEQMALCVTPELNTNNIADGLPKEMNTHATIRLRQNFQFFDWKARPSVCDNLNHTQSQGLPVLPGNAQIRYDKRCSGCHTAVYCSQECQTEDWTARHRRECRGMEHDYNEYERLHTPYSYNTRTFQLAALRALYSRKAHVWAPASTPMDKGGNRPVITLDVTRWDILNRVDDLHYFIGENRTLIPKHLTKRFAELVKRFEEDVKFEFGLVNGVFWFGSLDINLVVLFRRARGAPLRPGEASDFEVEGTVMFTCPRREWRKRPIQLVGFEGHAGRDEHGRILQPIADLMGQLGISQEDRL